jgi:hypothetical protein
MNIQQFLRVYITPDINHDPMSAGRQMGGISQLIRMKMVY